MYDMYSQLAKDLYTNILSDGRYLLYLEGLGNTFIIALGATVLGILLGAIIAIIKVYAVDDRRLRPLERICDIYLTVIRGTPVVVQLLILYYVVFGWAPATFQLPIAILSFGINSGAYVAEIIRAGIMSIDRGQTEAGRSLGLTQNATMRHIILPQAIKNILPPLFNELIVLIKETAVVSLIAIRDLTMAATLIRSRTFNAYVPLLFIAAVYLVIVLGLTKVQKRIEERMRQNDSR